VTTAKGTCEHEANISAFDGWNADDQTMS